MGAHANLYHLLDTGLMGAHANLYHLLDTGLMGAHANLYHLYQQMVQVGMCTHSSCSFVQS